LSEQGPSALFDASTAATHNPGRVTVFVNNFFHLLRVYAMPGEVLDIVFIPLRLQLLKPHAHSIS